MHLILIHIYFKWESILLKKFTTMNKRLKCIIIWIFPIKKLKQTLSRISIIIILEFAALKPQNHGKDFLKLLKLGKFDQAIKPLNNLYAEIPNEWYRNISVSNYEVWYASALLFTFLGNDCNVRAEESSYFGRSDFVLKDKGYVFVFELKVIEGNKKDNQAEISEAVKLAFEQIKQRNYLAKYSTIRNTLYSVAVVMSQKDRNIVKLEFQKHTQET